MSARHLARGLCLLLMLTSYSAEAMRIKITGKGGLVVVGDETKVCPQNAKETCAIMECGWRTCLVYLWDYIFEADMHDGKGMCGDAPATLTPWSSSAPMVIYRVTFASLTHEQITEGMGAGTPGNELHLKLTTEEPGF